MSTHLINWIKDKLLSMRELIQDPYFNNQCIEYRIIDCKPALDTYIIQDNNTHALYYFKFDELISNIDILSRIDQTQICYLGLANCNNHLLNFKDIRLASRFGNYEIHSFTRNSNVCLLDKSNNQLIVLSLEQIIHKKILNQFDSLQALYVGAIIGRQLSISNL
jgi:hypothetical protein